MSFDTFEDEKSPQEKVAEYGALIKKIDAEIVEKELIKESLTDSMVRSVKSIVTPFSMLKDVLPTAMKQQHEKLKKDRGTYEFVKDKIIELFFHGDKTAKLTDITSEGWENYAYWFYVEYKDATFMLKIPDVRRAEARLLKYMNYGMYSVSYQNTPSISTQLAASYNEKDITKAVDDFFKKKTIDPPETEKDEEDYERD